MNIQENAIVKTERSASIDLFRIISMFMVVVLHVLGAGGILYTLSPKSANWFLLGGLESVCIIAVNCFALTTGFLYVGRKTKIKNLLNLYLQVLFYSLIIALILFATGLCEFSIKELLNYLLPILSGRYWYFSAYFILYLIMPLLNLILEKTDKSFMFTLVIGAIVLFGVYAYSGSLVFGDTFHIDNGYTFVWLAVCYLIGGTIKKYEIFSLKKSRVWLICYLICALLTYGVSFVLSALKGYTRPLFVGEYNFILNVLSSIFLLMFFANLKMKNNKIISFISKSTFGVFLLHEQKMLKGIAIVDKFIFVSNLSPILAVLCVLGISSLIYVVGTVVDIARLYLFKLLRVNKLSNKVDEKIVKAYNKLKEKLDFNEKTAL